jgi:hypothetical protein
MTIDDSVIRREFFQKKLEILDLVAMTLGLIVNIIVVAIEEPSNAGIGKYVNRCFRHDSFVAVRKHTILVGNTSQIESRTYQLTLESSLNSTMTNKFTCSATVDVNYLNHENNILSKQCYRL